MTEAMNMNTHTDATIIIINVNCELWMEIKMGLRCIECTSAQAQGIKLLLVNVGIAFLLPFELFNPNSKFRFIFVG